ncbi:hypothetical protein [Streptomyces carpinensis]|uniref:Uncharacterized protein n=1 Tax=Streptomyces carpinensis TaxID=66369 RepID=A0ABV1W7J0_9ACTN|nr:hypothetical protein [Streptomyces carpinensis]
MQIELHDYAVGLVHELRQRMFTARAGTHFEPVSMFARTVNIPVGMMDW